MSINCISNNIFTCISQPWKTEGNFIEKIAAWALFFFGGFVLYLCQVSERSYEHYTDPTSLGLFNFSRSDVHGQVNGLYILTNETNLEETQNVIKTHPKPEGMTLHMGCASWHNLDIIFARKSTYGLLFDYNPKNAEFIGKTKELVRVCPTRLEFIQAMTRYLNCLDGAERNLYFHWDSGSLLQRIENELTREGSWLSSDDSYTYIKEEIIEQNRLVSITESVSHSQKFISLHEFCEQKNLILDTLYTSNIENFVTHSDFKKFVNALAGDDTILIHCPQINGQNSIRQETNIGKITS